MTNHPEFDRILDLERPDPALWRYYIITSILSGPFIIFTLPYLFFRYHTLRYRFDAEGIHMKVGLLFRREINLTYARIQDIHLRSGLIQRWFGLANVDIQTASGSTGAELVIEGFKQYEAIRDFLYTRMRGYQVHRDQPGTTPPQIPGPSGLAPAMDVSGARPEIATPSSSEELVSVLVEIRNELRRTRELIAASKPGSPPPNV